MKKKLNILITGASCVTSRSVLRSLKLSERFKDSRFIGTDISENTYGIYAGLYNKFYRVPHSNANDYLSVINKIITDEKIDGAIIIPELEVLTWSKHKFPTSYIVPSYKFAKEVINKALLYKMLNDTEFIPKYDIINRNKLLNEELGIVNKYPMWIRDFSSGSTSGKGALKVNNIEELKSWVIINNDIDEFLISEYLEGGNYACHLLYHKNEILKIACYERLSYIMSRVAPSGITGNISRGKLINSKHIVDISSNAIEHISAKLETEMNGLVAVDLKANAKGRAFITEINIRHVAATSAFAEAGFNLSEYHLLLSLRKANEIDKKIEMVYPSNNMILRDVDGLPIWVTNYKELEIGESVCIQDSSD